MWPLSPPNSGAICTPPKFRPPGRSQDRPGFFKRLAHGAPSASDSLRRASFTPPQLVALRAVLDRLIPADDFPGALAAGTCRMSSDPRDGVTDSFGRVHGHDNLFVCDGSLHVTNGGFNPALTIMALAFRTADHLLALG